MPARGLNACSSISGDSACFVPRRTTSRLPAVPTVPRGYGLEKGSARSSSLDVRAFQWYLFSTR